MRSGVKQPDGRVERWREHRVARRASIVDATMEALAEYGPDVSMSQIASVAGVAKPRIYRHFESRADLVNAVAERARETILTRLAAALDPTAPVREIVRGSLDAFFGFVEEHPNTIKLLMDNAAPGEGRANAILENSRIVATVLIAVTSADLSAEHVSTDGVEPLTHALIGSVLGATDWWLLQPVETRMPRERLVEHLTTVLLGAAESAVRAIGLVLDPDAPVSGAHFLSTTSRDGT